MSDAYIIDAVRSPIGRRGGGLSHLHPADLAGTVLAAAVERSTVPADVVDDVILGCVNAIGAQTGNIARIAWLSGGLPDSVPGVTVDRRCGSSQQAVDFAAHAIMARAHDVVVAGGIEMMSLVPIGSPATDGETLGYGHPYGSLGWTEAHGDVEVSQFRAADIVAERLGITRPDMEEFAMESHRRAAAAWENGWFDREVVHVADVHRDEGIRHDTTLEQMAALPTLREGGHITAAVSSQISDAAAALVVASQEAVDRWRLRPRARIHTTAVVGSDPVDMLTGPVPATKKALSRAGLAIEDIDLFEVNEAFASVVLMWAEQTGASLERTNVCGGAIALGHPLGATGARLMTTLVSQLERTGGRYGMQVMCEAGGTANATIIERIG